MLLIPWTPCPCLQFLSWSLAFTNTTPCNHGPPQRAKALPQGGGDTQQSQENRCMHHLRTQPHLMVGEPPAAGREVISSLSSLSSSTHSWGASLGAHVLLLRPNTLPLQQARVKDSTSEQGWGRHGRDEQPSGNLRRPQAHTLLHKGPWLHEKPFTLPAVCPPALHTSWLAPAAPLVLLL